MDDRTLDPFPLTTGDTPDSRSHLGMADHRFVIDEEEFLPHATEMRDFRVAKRHWSAWFEHIRRANGRVSSTVVPLRTIRGHQGLSRSSGETRRGGE